MEHIVEQLNSIVKQLPETVKLIAVSKTKPTQIIQQVYDAGQRVFGENKAQELNEKYNSLPKDIEWHFIGHLQTNKVKYIAPFVSMIHSIDSLKLLLEVNKQGIKNNRIINCLLQFYIAEEETKFGLDLQEAKEILLSEDFLKMKNVQICGVMGMATFTEDKIQIHKEFSHLSSIYQTLKTEFFQEAPFFSEISMGMTDDYPIAIEEGSTMVRIGSAIFGKR